MILVGANTEADVDRIIPMLLLPPDLRSKGSVSTACHQQAAAFLGPFATLSSRRPTTARNPDPGGGVGWTSSTCPRMSPEDQVCRGAVSPS